MERKITKEIHIGDRVIGGGNPILIQSMTQHQNRRCRCNSRTDPAVGHRRAVILSVCAVPTMEAACALEEHQKAGGDPGRCRHSF